MLSRRFRPGGWVLIGIAVLLSASDSSACADFHSAPSSRWSIGKSAAGPVLLSPCGEPFFSLGVNAVDGGASSASMTPRAYRWDRFAASLSDWATNARHRLLEWGFNTAGAWSLAPSEIGLPNTPELDLGRIVQFVWKDPFDPSLASELRRAAVEAVAPFRGEPLRIGYFSDNEIGWWNGPLFLAYMADPPSNHTKQRLLTLLRAHYDDSWDAFIRDFIPAAGTSKFDDLLASRSPPHLRPGGHGIDIIRAWTRVFAARYYSAMREALRAADPDALFLGDRLPIYYDPDAVRAMAPYVDAISVNYNVDSADGWVAPYFFNGLRDLSGNKPVLITEWFFAATENRSGNLNRTGAPRTADSTLSNNRNRTGHLMTVTTQAERARGAERAAALLAAVPGAIGVHWFEYADEPPGGRADGEDYDFGLVDIDDHPYEELTRSLRNVNRSAQLRVPPKAADPEDSEIQTVLPLADINPVTESLVDWPKAASRLGLTPAPSEVAFGDVYLAWNEKGLLLATISMDYYDPDLLGQVMTFPRSEAFRIALGVDAGGGPHRIEFRVVPTQVVHTSNKETKLSFAVETCRYETADNCSPIPGAVARYFGTALDQPRVILKAFIPWTQLGLAGPPGRAVLRLELGVTAFYRSKWMAFDGVMPEIGMAHPETWRPVKLGGAAPDWLRESSRNTAAEHSN
jgi:hypothetical protein